MSSRYTKLSKYLSLILRHKPHVIGIELDRHGWDNVSEVVEGIAKTREFSLDILEEIVRTDDKQRYSFNDDHTKIRANQGHSIKVDLGLVSKEPPSVLYHGTSEKSLRGILENGILPMSRQYVHLSKDIDTASAVGKRHGKPTVLRVNARLMYADGYNFYMSENGYWLTDKVPYRYCTLV